jgi:hypothetical protein
VMAHDTCVELLQQLRKDIQVVLSCDSGVLHLTLVSTVDRETSGDDRGC